MFRQPNLNAWRVRRILKSYADPSPITVSNSANPPCVKIRLCKHRKSAPLLKYKIHVTMQHFQVVCHEISHLYTHTFKGSYQYKENENDSCCITTMYTMRVPECQFIFLRIWKTKIKILVNFNFHFCRKLKTTIAIHLSKFIFHFFIKMKMNIFRFLFEKSENEN